jgi:hypothetical protein
MERISKALTASLNELTKKVAVTVEYDHQIGEDARALVAALENFQALIG